MTGKSLKYEPLDKLNNKHYPKKLQLEVILNESDYDWPNSPDYYKHYEPCEAYKANKAYKAYEAYKAFEMV